MLAIILYLFRFVRLQGSGHQAWSPRTEIAKLTRAAFAHDDFISELKMDGFRALADVGPDETRLVSREGNVYPFPAYKTCRRQQARGWCFSLTHPRTSVMFRSEMKAFPN